MSKKTLNDISTPGNEKIRGRPQESLEAKASGIWRYLLRAKREHRDGVLKYSDEDFEHKMSAWREFDGIEPSDKENFGAVMNAWVEAHLSHDSRTKLLVALRRKKNGKTNRSLDVHEHIANQISYMARDSGKTITELLTEMIGTYQAKEKVKSIAGKTLPTEKTSKFLPKRSRVK